MSEHFKESEFTCHCGCGGCKVNPDLITLLEKIRGLLGRPITILSGFRCEAHNKKVKGAKDSQHKLGNAADITVDGMQPSAVHDFLTKNMDKEIGGMGKYKGFTHVDVRQGHARWTG